MSKPARDAYERDVREWRLARAGGEHRYGCTSLYIGAGLAVAVYIAAGLGLSDEIIAALLWIGHAFGRIEQLPVAIVVTIAALFVLVVAFEINFRGRWIIEIPMWFAIFLVGIALVLGPVLRVLSW